jgi:hypothetical protein
MHPTWRPGAATPRDIPTLHPCARFTATPFTGRVNAAGAQFGVDGHGGAFDIVCFERPFPSVDDEEVHLLDYASVTDVRDGLGRHFGLHEEAGLHQALGYRARAAMYLVRQAA